MDEKFPPSCRILKRREYELVFKKGDRINKGFCSIIILERERGGPRLGLVVSKKVGNAVARNRIKRVARDIFRRSRSRWAGVDIVFIARKQITNCGYDQIEKAFLALTVKFPVSLNGKRRC